MSEMRILIVDDHQLFIEGLKHILKNELNLEEFDIATNGKEAIEKCNKSQYDLVLMDINMPKLDGIYACREIKSHKPQTKVIFITMLIDLNNAKNAIKAGADGFVYKGNSSDELIQAIKEIKVGKIYITETLRHFFNDPNSADQIKNPSIKFLDSVITQREKEILKLISEGLTNEQIAIVLSIAGRTVDTHRNNMLTKLKLPNTAALVKFGMKNGLIE